MLETTNVLVNKLSMRIMRPMNGMNGLEASSIILDILFRQICEQFDAMLDWRAFARGGSYNNTDHSLHGLSAYTQADDGSLLWASSFYIKDRQFTRRRWKYYFGIRQLSDDEAIFYYAKCRYDHMAGSISPAKPDRYTRDTLADPLFYDPNIVCMIGNQPYPVGAVNLNVANLHEFIAMILDKQRSIPVMLITCPDVITPEIMSDMTLGNLAIYWCDDSRIIMQMNTSLPRDLRTTWDTVRVFMPIYNDCVFHPCYPYEDIHRMGIDSFFNGIRRAYCENMHSEERRSFLTVCEVLSVRDRKSIQKLEALNREQSSQLIDVTAKLKQQSKELKSIREKIEMMSAKSQTREINELESLLSETITEADALKTAISSLSTELYSTMGIGFKPNQSQSIALIQELSNAIYASLQCAQGRN